MTRCTCPCCSSLSRFVALLILTLAACAPVDDVDQPWPRFATRPVHVQASSELPVQCQLAVAASVAFWRERGVSMDAEVVEPWLPSQIGVPVAGVLTVKPGKPSSHDALNEHPWAEVIRTLTIGGDIYWAEMTLDTCDLMVVLHETGHGLGLPDNEVRGNLMNGNLGKAGLALTDEQLDHVDDDGLSVLVHE